MRVEQSSQVVGWENNNKVTLVKKTYHYDEGNNVTVVEKRKQSYTLYGIDGKEISSPQLGQNLDKRI
jgi:hypothetical protein